MTNDTIDTAHDDDAPDGLRGGAWPVEWRDIASAPKDATNIVLYVPAKNLWATSNVGVGHWASDLSGSEQPAFQGWFFYTGHGYAQFDTAPTHWMPLPTPPVGAA